MKLLYFTASYPFGIGEQWKANELNVLVKHFDRITVVPFSFAGNFDSPKPLPAGVTCAGPLFKDEKFPLAKRSILKVLTHRKAFMFMREFFTKRVYRKKSRLISWLGTSLHIIRLLDNPALRKLLAEADDRTVLYFYWGRGACEVLPFISERSFHKVFVRMHRFDLFEYENGSYIPYRSALLDSIDVAAPSSEAGLSHLQQLYPNAKAKISVVRCGTLGTGKRSQPSGDHVLRIVSCSFLSPVKRVHLMVEAMSKLAIPAVWHHIGDGTLKDELKKKVAALGIEDKFIFEGMMDSRKVLEYYTDHQVDVLVNASSSEGVPFSIMEAFSVGIPVLATNVGGSGELVDDTVGGLLPADLDPTILAKALEHFYAMSATEKLSMRQRAFDRYQESWNAEKLTEELAKLLKSK